jgi:hypothetical protein
VIVPWYQDMATERTQYSTIRCTFLWEEFLRLSSVFAQLSLRFEDPDILSRPFNKVDEIDMLLTDSLRMRTLSIEKSNGLRN